MNNEYQKTIIINKWKINEIRCIINYYYFKKLGFILNNL